MVEDGACGEIFAKRWAGADPVKERTAKNSVNSLNCQAKSFFARGASIRSG